MRLLNRLLAGIAIVPVMASADVPRVATDIAPVQSLVARVMKDVGTPSLVIRQGASPHGYSMRPSEARALANADLVFWIGHGLTPWLEQPIENLSADAEVIELSALSGTIIKPYREGENFEAHDHDHGEVGHDDHHDADHHDAENHDDEHHDQEHHDHEHHADGHHDDEDHSEHADHHDHEHHDEKHAAHDGHDDEEDHHAHGEHHAHDESDPHMWLDPRNASYWLEEIAEHLSELDPENAALYARNATEGQEELAMLEVEVSGQLVPFRNESFIVFHDAYQYFEARFGVPAAASIAPGDASKLGPARISKVREIMQESGASCVFSEPQFNADLVDTVREDLDVGTAILDPHGAGLTLGAELYPELIRAMANSFEACLK